MKNLVKKTLFIFLFISLITIEKSSCQYTLQTAINVQIFAIPSSAYGVNHALPPLGTNVPAGPDYGSMNIPTNPMWYYLPTCMDFPDATIDFDFSNTISLSLSPGNVLVWGPFDNISSINLADLNSSKLMYCDTFPLNLSPYYSSILVTGIAPKKVYIILLTCVDALLPGDVWLSVNSSSMVHTVPGGPLYDSCHLCNGQAAYAELQKTFCMVTVDTSVNHNLLVWEKDPSDFGIAGYVIKKFAMTQYDSVAYIPASSFSTWVDTNSNPMTQKYFYQLEPVDSCGNQYPSYTDPVFSQIFLQASPSTNNTVNLTWDRSSTWFYNSFNVHYIWRSSNGSPFTIIDSLAVGGAPYISYYTDVTAPAGSVVYFIEQRKISPCYPSMLPANGSSLSNLSGGTVTGLAEVPVTNNISIYPNPFSNSTIIDFSKLHDKELTLTVKSLNGQLLFETVTANQQKFVFEKGNLSKGIYLLEIKGEGVWRKKLVVD